MYKIFLSLCFLFVIWTLADCPDIKYMDLGDVFKNGCGLIYALSTAALTGHLVVSGSLCHRRTVLGTAVKLSALH